MAVKPDIVAPSLLDACKIIEKEMKDTEQIFIDPTNFKEIEENSEKIRTGV